MFHKSLKAIRSSSQICLSSLLVPGLSLLFFIGSLTVCLPATALLRQHHEADNVLRYHAQDSLKDRDGNTWQVLLFPENSDSTTNYYLRLVGFPGINSFVHPQSLEILTSQGKIFDVKDVYSQSSPAPNVGQYDLTAIADRLTAKGHLKLSVPLQQGSLSLKIPQEVLAEWQLLTRELEPNQ